MVATWTSEQVAALAPDASSGKAARELANARKWIHLGGDDHAAWGEHQGSGSSPYQIVIDLDEPAFHCTCPSRKFPCKHALGLFLLRTEQPAAFVQSAVPPWVAEWLLERASKPAKKKRTPKNGTDQPGEMGADAGAQQGRARKTAEQTRRAAQREDRVAAGLQELERWLRDLVKQGLAAAQTQPPQFWEGVATRMVDAQAPGAARMIREMPALAASGEGWTERLLERIGLLYLLLEGYNHIDVQTEATRADIHAALGFSLKQEEVIARPGLVDQWLVLGRRVFEDERLRSQRTWLHGRRTGRCALLLDFAYGGQVLDTSILPGTQFEAELAFYPGNYPLRAALKQRLSETRPLTGIPAYPDWSACLSAYAGALARNPWIEAFPAAITMAFPTRREDAWQLRDQSGHALPLTPQPDPNWQLLAQSGGHPITVLGEWNGHALFPLSAATSDSDFLILD
jgi:hypothetical protein